MLEKIDCRHRTYCDRQLNCIVFFLYSVIVTDILRQATSIIGLYSAVSLVETARNVIYICVFALYYVFSDKKTICFGLCTGFAYAFLLLLTILVNQEFRPFVFSVSLLMISRSLLGFVMISRLKQPQELIEKVMKFSWVTIVYMIVYSLAPKDLSTGYSYSITFSYNLLLPAVACFYCFIVLKKKKLYSLLIFIADVVGIFVYGSRGTIVCVGIAIVYILFFGIKTITAKQFVLKAGMVLLGGGAFLFRDSIFLSLSKHFPNSRTIDLLLNNSFFWDSNRSIYFNIAKEYFRESPLTFRGLAGDVFVYAEKMGVNLELGRHSHNIFLEILVSYGLIFGGVVCIGIFAKLFVAFFYSKKNKDMMVVFACIISPLLPYTLISGSLCQSYQHWLLLGALFSALTKKARQV